MLHPRLLIKVLRKQALLRTLPPQTTFWVLKIQVPNNNLTPVSKSLTKWKQIQWEAVEAAGSKRAGLLKRTKVCSSISRIHSTDTGTSSLKTSIASQSTSSTERPIWLSASKTWSACSTGRAMQQLVTEAQVEVRLILAWPLKVSTGNSRSTSCSRFTIS